MTDPHDKLRDLAREALRKDQPDAWFEPLYQQAGDDPSTIPWADGKPNPHLVAWLDANQHSLKPGSAAVVVGCGLGDDAEEIQKRGLSTRAFDLSASAIQWARRRFPESGVRYFQADLLKLPSELLGQFDFVFEAYTVQAMPHSHRPDMLKAVASLVTAGGKLLLICRGRDESDDPGSLPWPLTRDELKILDESGLKQHSFEDFIDTLGDEPTRRFRVCYHKPSA